MGSYLFCNINLICFSLLLFLFFISTTSSTTAPSSFAPQYGDIINFYQQQNTTPSPIIDEFCNVNVSSIYLKTQRLTDSKFTLSLWVKYHIATPSTNGSKEGVIQVGGINTAYATLDDYGYFGLVVDHQHQFFPPFLGPTFNKPAKVTFDEALPATIENEWHHLVYVRDVTIPDVNKREKIYIDGRLYSESGVESSTSVLGIDVESDMVIGLVAMNNTYYPLKSLSVEDVRLYSKAFSQSEVQDLYQSIISVTGTPQFVTSMISQIKNQTTSLDLVNFYFQSIENDASLTPNPFQVDSYLYRDIFITSYCKRNLYACSLTGCKSTSPTSICLHKEGYCQYTRDEIEGIPNGLSLDGTCYVNLQVSQNTSLITANDLRKNLLTELSDTSSSFTFEFGVYLPSSLNSSYQAKPFMGILGTLYDNYNGVGAYLSTVDFTIIFQMTTNKKQYLVNTQKSIPFDQYTYISIVVSRINGIIIYMNGALIKHEPQLVMDSDEHVVHDFSKNTFMVGVYDTLLDDYYFIGHLDEIRIWSTELMSSTINSYKKAKLRLNSNVHPNQDKLLLHYNFDHIELTQANDAKILLVLDMKFIRSLNESYGDGYLYDGQIIRLSPTSSCGTLFYDCTYLATSNLPSTPLRPTGNANACYGNTNYCDYADNRCKLINICYGYDEFDANVCSGNGLCVGQNQCQCDILYGGDQCEIPLINNGTCYDIPALSPLVCSGKGTCNTTTQTCECKPHYYGPQCQYTTCYGIGNDYLSTGACSNHGECVDYDHCVCNPGFYNFDCSMFDCYNKTYNDTTVCSANGDCLAPNSCKCKLGYSDLECQTPVCFGVKATDPKVCSGFGQCVAPDTCICTTSGASGQKCDQFKCGEYYNIDSRVCSGNGTCVAPQVCDCKNGYIGAFCEQIACYNISASDREVCSGNGTCIGPNQCLCNQGYDGDKCERPAVCPTGANGKVCSGNGICVKDGRCNCYDNDQQGHWAGTTCSICKPNYTGPECKELFCDPTLTCKDRGSCNGNYTCDCNGNYEAPFCETCKPGYYGNLCDTYCDVNKCSNRGYCDPQSGQCICNTPDYSPKTNCAGCTEGYYGPYCDIQLPKILNFTREGDKIAGYFRNGRAVEITSTGNEYVVPCSSIWKDYQVFGKSATCKWLSETSFVIVLGSAATIKPDTYTDIDVEKLILALTGTAGPHTFWPVLIAGNTDPVPPIARIAARRRAALLSCGFEYIIVDGSQSYSPDRRPLIYSWSIDTSYVIPNARFTEGVVKLKNFLIEHRNDATLFVPKTMLLAAGPAFGYVYPFTLTVKSSLSTLESKLYSKAIIGIPYHVPGTVIDGSFTETVTIPLTEEIAKNGYVLSAGLTKCPSFPKVLSKWVQTSGTPLKFTKSLSQLLIDPASLVTSVLQTPTTQTFSFELWSQFDSSIHEMADYLSIRFTVPDMMAIIAGATGNAQYINLDFTLDGRFCIDPIDPYSELYIPSYSWVCTELPYNAPCTFDLPSTTASQLFIPANTVTSPGKYNFTLTFSKLGRTPVSTSVVVQFINAITPTVSLVVLAPTEGVITNNQIIYVANTDRFDKISIQGDYSLPSNADPQQVKISWTEVNHNLFTDSFVKDYVKTKIEGNTGLSVNATGLVPGVVYKFRFSVTYIPSQITSSIDVSVRVNEPPKEGTIFVKPTEGIVYNTSYALITSMWYDEDMEDNPLLFEYGYIWKGQPFPITVTSKDGVYIFSSLPVGDKADDYKITLYISALDAFGAVTTVTTTVKSMPPIIYQNTNARSTLAIQADDIYSSFANDYSARLIVDAESNQNIDDIFTAVSSTASILALDETNEGRNIRKNVVRNLVQALTNATLTMDILPLDDEFTISKVGFMLNFVVISTMPTDMDMPLLEKCSHLIDNVLRADSIEPFHSYILHKSLDPLLLHSFPKSYSSISNDATTLDTVKNLKGTLDNIILHIQGSFRKYLIPNEAIYILNGDAVALEIGMYDATSLDAASVLYGTESTSVILPDNFISSNLGSIMYIRDGRKTFLTSKDVFSAECVLYAINPFVFYEASQNVTSTIVDFSLRLPSGNDIIVAGLSLPINILLEGDFSKATSKRNLPTAIVLKSFTNDFPMLMMNSLLYSKVLVEKKLLGVEDTLSEEELSKLINFDGYLMGDNYQTGTYFTEEKSINVTCRYWDVDTQLWKSDGCFLISYSQNSINCACNHLTTFSAEVVEISNIIPVEPPILPKPPTPIPSPVNIDTSGVFIMPLVTALVLIVGSVIFVGIVVFEFFFTEKPTESSKLNAKEMIENMGRFRKIWETIKSHHVYITLFSFDLPLKEFMYKRSHRYSVSLLTHMISAFLCTLIIYVSPASFVSSLDPVFQVSVPASLMALFIPYLFRQAYLSIKNNIESNVGTTKILNVQQTTSASVDQQEFEIAELTGGIGDVALSENTNGNGNGAVPSNNGDGSLTLDNVFLLRKLWREKQSSKRQSYISNKKDEGYFRQLKILLELQQHVSALFDYFDDKCDDWELWFRKSSAGIIFAKGSTAIKLSDVQKIGRRLSIFTIMLAIFSIIAYAIGLLILIIIGHLASNNWYQNYFTVFLCVSFVVSIVSFVQQRHFFTMVELYNSDRVEKFTGPLAMYGVHSTLLVIYGLVIFIASIVALGTQFWTELTILGYCLSAAIPCAMGFLYTASLMFLYYYVRPTDREKIKIPKLPGWTPSVLLFISFILMVGCLGGVLGFSTNMTTSQAVTWVISFVLCIVWDAVLWKSFSVLAHLIGIASIGDVIDKIVGYE
ncbi:hypothetical protein ABK040_005501 [Willaertia magna]